ncbi:MAG: hypothetical protein LBS96_08260 [Oscillospiraceae bacterium]|jgi:hypothetical protein|nr:hypothetical protein [Oscillospiraceae bacterium]
MKTLLVHYSNRSIVRAMCEASNAPDVDVLQLQPRYKKRPVLDDVADCYRALAGKGARLLLPEFLLEEYESIVLVTSLRAFAPSPEINEFLFRCDLGGRDVNCIVCNRIRSFGRAGSALRKRVRLAGGVCRSITYVSEADLALKSTASIIALQETAAEVA